MGMNRRKFRGEFKEAKVRRLELGVSIAEAARAYEVNPKVLHRWRRELRQFGQKAFPDRGRAGRRRNWISDPRPPERASNEIVQLDAARRLGISIPSTLVSQIQRGVRQFYLDNGQQVVVKPVVGTPGPLLFTQMLSDKQAAATLPDTETEKIIVGQRIAAECFLHVTPPHVCPLCSCRRLCRFDHCAGCHHASLASLTAL